MWKHAEVDASVSCADWRACVVCAGYGAYEAGVAGNLFVKQGDGVTDFIGAVWPGSTAFPDFLHPNTSAYWSGLIGHMLDTVPYDGLWIDMNEISDFRIPMPDNYNNSLPVNNPPYKINNCEENTRNNGPLHLRSRERMCAS